MSKNNKINYYINIIPPSSHQNMDISKLNQAIIIIKKY